MVLSYPLFPVVALMMYVYLGVPAKFFWYESIYFKSIGLIYLLLDSEICSQ